MGGAGAGSVGWGEGAGVEQASGAQCEVAAQFGELCGEWRGDGVCGAEGGVGYAAPGCAVVCGVGDAGADVPAGGSRDGAGGQFVRMEADGVLVGAGVPVDAVAAVAATG